MRNDGETVRSIASSVGVEVSTVFRDLRRLKADGHTFPPSVRSCAQRHAQADTLRRRALTPPPPLPPDGHPTGTPVCWTTYYAGEGTPSRLHKLGHGRDGQGYHLTVCGTLAHPLPEGRNYGYDHVYGQEAEGAGREECGECWR